MLQNLIATIAVAFVVAGLVAARPTGDKKLVTKVYDLKQLLGEKGKINGFADMEAFIKVILDTLPIGELKPGTDGPQIIERDGGKLEVRTTPELHGELKDLLEAIERLADVAVDIKAEVIELDAASFEKLTKALPKTANRKRGSPVLFASDEENEEKEASAELQKALKEVNKILRGGREVQSSSARFTNGVEATISRAQSVLAFHSHVANNKPSGPPQFVKEGFKLAGLPLVSADRRFVRFKLMEQSTGLVGIAKRDLGEVVEGQKLVATSPELEDLGVTGSAVVADGGALLFRLAYAPKDKVWVVMLHPTIYIKAEDNEEAMRLKRLEEKETRVFRPRGS